GRSVTSDAAPTDPAPCPPAAGRRARPAAEMAGTVRRCLLVAFRPTACWQRPDRPSRFRRELLLRLARAARAAPDHARWRTSPAPPPARRLTDGCRRYWKIPRADCRCTFP